MKIYHGIEQKDKLIELRPKIISIGVGDSPGDSIVRFFLKDFSRII